MIRLPRNEQLHGGFGDRSRHRHGRPLVVVQVTEPKTFTERLDAARNGQEFGLVIQDMFTALDSAKDSIDRAAAALKDVEDDNLLLTQAECQTVQKVWQFSRILCAAGLLDDDHVGHYMEKPWKWQTEFEIWQVRGCPDLDGDAEAFDAFADAAAKATGGDDDD